MKVENIEDFKNDLKKVTTHSPIGASSMYRWSQCPGSVSLSKDMPSSTSKYAEEGTEAHDWLAKVICGLVPITAVPEDK